jgi:hypothetical protein
MREALEKVRALVANPNTWTRGQFARTADDQSFRLPLDPEAARWCLRGAVARACNDSGLVTPESSEAIAVRDALIRAVASLGIDVPPGKHQLTHVNDELGREKTLEVVERAIADSPEEEKLPW